MIDLQTILTYLTLISVPVGVFYHIMTLNNTRKNQQLQLETRQAQLYMNIINTFNTTDFRKQWHLVESATWTDYNDFHEKYHPGTEELTAVVRHFTFFESIGSLVDKKLVEVEIIDGILALAIVVTWRKYEDVIVEDREHFRSPTMWIHFENLYNELSKREEFSDTKVADFVAQ